MEDVYTVILILGTLFGLIGSAIYYKKSTNPVKKAQKRNESSLFDNLTEYREVEKGTILDILKQKDSQIKSLNLRIKNLEPIEEEIEDLSGKKVTWEEIQALVQQVAPKYALALPVMKKQIMEMTKGMTMQELLEYVKQFTGSQQSQGKTDPQSINQNPDWA